MKYDTIEIIILYDKVRDMLQLGMFFEEIRIEIWEHCAEREIDISIPDLNELMKKALSEHIFDY